MVYKVCAYTLWSVLEINTGFRRLRRKEDDWLVSDEEIPLLLFFLLPVSVFLVPPGPT